MPRTYQPGLFSPVGVAVNFALNLAPIALSIFASVYLSRQARPENCAILLKLFALLGQMLLTSAVMINFYRDFDWSGPNNIFTAFGYPKRLDAYHPTELSIEDNALICGRTTLVAVGVAAALLFKHELVQRYKKQPTHKQAMIKRVTFETLGALFGLLAWNIPGWIAFRAYNFGTLNFTNYVTMSIAVGFLEGLTQAVFAKLNNPSQSYLSPNFMKKLLVGWFAGALWNVSFVGQDISAISPSTMDRDANFRAFNLALTVAIFNGLVSILHTAIDKNIHILDSRNFSLFLDRELGYDALPTKAVTCDLNNPLTAILLPVTDSEGAKANTDDGVEETKGDGDTHPPAEIEISLDSPMKDKGYLSLYALGTIMTMAGACFPGLSNAVFPYLSFALMAVGLGTSSLAHYVAPPSTATVLQDQKSEKTTTAIELSAAAADPV